jgi:hypothetical protein
VAITARDLFVNSNNVSQPRHLSERERERERERVCVCVAGTSKIVLICNEQNHYCAQLVLPLTLKHPRLVGVHRQ